MFPVAAAFLGAFVYALAAIVNSHICNAVIKSPLTITFYASVTNFLFLPFLLLFGTPSLPSQEAVPVYLLLAVFMVVMNVPTYQAFKENDASIVNCLWTLGKVLIPFMAFFFLDEKLSFLQYVGFFLIIFANLMLNFNPSAKLKLNNAFYLIAFASILGSCGLIMEKYLLMYDENWLNLIIYVNIFSVFISCAFLLRSKWRKDIKNSLPVFRKAWKYFGGAEMLSFAGHALGIWALAKLPAVVKESISSTEPVFVLIISILLILVLHIRIKENIRPANVLKKVVAFSLVAAGVVLSMG